MQGSILDTEPRLYMPIWLYVRLIVMLVDLGWLISGIVWIKEFYIQCPIEEPKETMFAATVCNLLVLLTMFATMWCTFDPGK